MKTYSPTNFFLPQGNIFLKATEKKLLSETTVPQAQPAFICLNSAILAVEVRNMFKLTIETPDVDLVSLLLTLHIFDI